MESSKYVLAIDIGGTSIKMGVLEGSTIIEENSVRNTFKGNRHNLIHGIKPICNEWIAKYNISKIGIGCPGDIKDGICYIASNLGWKDYNIKEDFEKNFKGCSVVVDNDGIAACKAEMTYGALKDVRGGIFITIGRGIGGAIVINNNIFVGAHEFGGRLGHMVIKQGKRKCSCGRKGCFEAYCSIKGLLTTTKEYNRKAPKENQIDDSDLSGFKLVKLKDNPIVSSAITSWNRDLAEGIMNLVNVFDPEVVVIAGGITESGLINLEEINTFISKFDPDACPIKLATFKSKNGLIGAGTLTL